MNNLKFKEEEVVVMEEAKKERPKLRLVQKKKPQVIQLSCRYCELREESSWSRLSPI